MKKRWIFTESSFLSPRYIVASLFINFAICLGLFFLMARSTIVQSVIDHFAEEIKPEDDKKEPEALKPEEKQKEEEAQKEPQEELQSTGREVEQVTEKILEPIVEDLKETLPEDLGDEADRAELEEMIKAEIRPEAEKLAREMLDEEKEAPAISELEKRVEEIREKAVNNFPEQLEDWRENILNREMAEQISSPDNIDKMVNSMEKNIAEIGKNAAQKAERAAQEQLKSDGDKKTAPRSKLSTFGQKDRQERLRSEFEKTLSRNLENELKKKIEKAVGEVRDPDLQKSLSVKKMLDEAMKSFSRQMDRKKGELFSALTKTAAKRGTSSVSSTNDQDSQMPDDESSTLEDALNHAEAEQREISISASKIGDETKKQIEKAQPKLEGGKKDEAVSRASVPKSRELAKTEKERAEDLDRSARMLKKLSEKAAAHDASAADDFNEAGNKLSAAAESIRDAGKALDKGESGKAAGKAGEAADKIAETAELSGKALGKVPENFLDESDEAAGKAEKAFNEETSKQMPDAVGKSLGQIRFEPASIASSLKLSNASAGGKPSMSVALRLIGEGGDEIEDIGELLETVAMLKSDFGKKTGFNSSENGNPQSSQSDPSQVKTDASGSPLLYRTAIDEELYRQQVEQISGRFEVLKSQQSIKSPDDSGALSPRKTADLSRFDPPEKVIAPSSAWKFMDETASHTQTTAVQKKRELIKPNWIDHWFGGVTFTGKNPKIDGDFGDWSEILLKMKTDTMDIKICYNPDGIFLAVTCKDSKPGIQVAGNNNFWEGDCLEVWFDMLEEKPDRIHFSKTCHQFFFWPKMTGELPGFEVAHQIGDTRKVIPLEPLGYKGYTAITNSGYNLEICLPPETIAGFSGGAKTGRFVGFNINLNNGGRGTSYFAGTDAVETSVRPKTWGDLLMLGTDARLDIGSAAFTASGVAEKKDEISFLAPGQKIYMQVDDKDRNIDRGRKDKVAVTVSTSSGKTELISLEETAENSGLFQAAMPTRLATEKQDIQGVLDVRQGDKVTVLYKDAIQAFGERNVPVRKILSVGLPVYKLVSRRKIL